MLESIQYYVHEHNIQVSRKGGIHLDSYMCTVDKPKAYLSAASMTSLPYGNLVKYVLVLVVGHDITYRN